MKTLIYRLMEEPALVNKIKAGTFAFPETVTEEEENAIIRAVQETTTVKGGFWSHL